MSRKKVTISCAHCGGMYTIEIDGEGVKHLGYLHDNARGCRGRTVVYLNYGNIVKTEKG